MTPGEIETALDQVADIQKAASRRGNSWNMEACLTLWDVLRRDRLMRRAATALEDIAEALEAGRSA